MRLLFVSGTTTGGSAVSTHGLASALAARGHAVGIVERRRTRPRTGLVVPTRGGVAAAVTQAPPRLARAVRRAAPMRAGAATSQGGVAVWTCDAPARVLEEVCDAFGPDVVVAGSVARNDWAAMRGTLRRRGVPSVLYVREAATLEHVPIRALRPDLAVTNSSVLRAAVVDAGVPAEMVPSLVDFSRCAVTSSRDVVLFVNPIESRGLTIALDLAAANPDVAFAFQRSWPLDPRDERALVRLVDGLPNVELRAHEADPARVYRDARLLLVPYLVDQRPRVVAEAQWNGIPVVASDLPGHREAVGDGGRFVSLSARTEAWTAALRDVWDDAHVAGRLGDAARVHAGRAEQHAGGVVDRFEHVVSALVGAGGRERSVG